MSITRPVVLCGALALALHAAVLFWHGGGSGGKPGGGAHAALLARRVERPPEASPQAPEPARPMPSDESSADTAGAAHELKPAAASAAAEATVGDDGPPQFDTAAPRLELPDAAMPASGVQVRVYVLLDAEGRPQTVSAASTDPEAPKAYRSMTERVLGEARWQATGAPQAHCLLARFAPDGAAPQLDWLPGLGANAGRCLSGPLPRARALPDGPG